MKLTKKRYTISVEMIEAILDTLNDYWFYYDEDGDSYNNDEVIALTKHLEAHLKAQQGEI